MLTVKPVVAQYHSNTI